MNGEVVAEIRNSAKVMPGTSDALPTTLSRVIIPTLEVNPKVVKNCFARNNRATNATSVNVYSTPTNQDFYIIAASLAVIKDVTSTSARSYLAYYENGLEKNILEIPGITLTVQSETISISFNHPLKVDRGTNITVNSTTNVANITASATIVGFLDEQSTWT